MPRITKRFGQIIVDLFVLSLAYWVAFLVRFEWDLPFQMIKRAFFLWPYVVGFQYGLLYFFGVPRYSWRYIGLREVKRILIATGVSSAILGMFRILSVQLMPVFSHAEYMLIPFGVILIDFLLAFLGIVGVRALRRSLAERVELSRRSDLESEPVSTMLIGAGQAGVMVAKEISARPDLGIRAVGFLDDDESKKGTEIHGIRVLGTTQELARLCQEKGAEQVLITIANAPGKEIRRITELCKSAGMPVKIIPGLYEIVGGRVGITRIRDVAIEDLLGRDPVQLEEDQISTEIRDKVVLVTGAGGSIGSELCRQVCRFSPAKLVLVERAENNLFNIHRELKAGYPKLDILPGIADISDRRRMERLFKEHGPAFVLHAAAHKHVPMMEWNPGEAVKNNVFGTKLVADLAHEHGVSRFVMISTDKAINPTSVMGATKRAAEMYIQALSQKSKTQFVTVRFGNVLGSAGSVIPIFKEQIARGGPVTVTHPDMKRYFMTIPEACQLVLQASVMGDGGEIFILDMGEPVKIVDLATDLIRLSGFEPGQDIEIVFTGIRPGEKLFEEISVAEEHADKTRHPKIYIGKSTVSSLHVIKTGLDELKNSINENKLLIHKLKAIVPEYLAK